MTLSIEFPASSLPDMIPTDEIAGTENRRIEIKKERSERRFSVAKRILSIRRQLRGTPEYQDWTHISIARSIGASIFSYVCFLDGTEMQISQVVWLTDGMVDKLEKMCDTFDKKERDKKHVQKLNIHQHKKHDP